MNVPIVPGPSQGQMISLLIGHLPSDLGVGKLWDFIFLSFSEGKREKKMRSEDSRYGLAFGESSSWPGPMECA